MANPTQEELNALLSNEELAPEIGTAINSAYGIRDAMEGKDPEFVKALIDKLEPWQKNVWNDPNFNTIVHAMQAPHISKWVYDKYHAGKPITSDILKSPAYKAAAWKHQADKLMADKKFMADLLAHDPSMSDPAAFRRAYAENNPDPLKELADAMQPIWAAENEYRKMFPPQPVKDGAGKAAAGKAPEGAKRYEIKTSYKPRKAIPSAPKATPEGSIGAPLLELLNQVASEPRGLPPVDSSLTGRPGKY